MPKLLKRLLQFFLILGISLALVTVYPIFIIGSILWLRLAVISSSLKCSRFRGVLVSPVTGVSAFLAPDKMFKNPNSTLIHLAVLESTPEPETVSSHLQSIYDLTSTDALGKTARKYAKLGYSLEPWWGYLFWKEIPNFDLRNQITFIHNKGLDPNNVSTFVEGIIRKPFRAGEPLWEVFVVSQCSEMASPEERSRTSCFVIFRTHHILLDGMSLVKFFYAADAVGDPKENPKENPIQPHFTYGTSSMKPRRNFFQRFITRMKIHCKGPYLSNKYLGTPGDNNVLMNIQNYKQFDGHWWCSGLNKIHLEKYRQPLRDLGFSLTHAILVGYGRGLKKFITDNYGIHNLPRKVHIMGSIPRPPHPPEALTNHWAIMRYKVDFTAETLLQELEQSRTEYARAVHDTIPKAFEQMHKIGLDRVPLKLYDLVWDTTKSGTLSLSNLPGPTSPQKMFGIPVTDRAIWLPLTRQNSGIGLLMLTYNGWATISITADSGCIKTRKLFNHLNQSIMSEMQFLLDEVLRMSQEAVGKGPVGKDANHNLHPTLNSDAKPTCETLAAELNEIKIV